MDLVKSCGEDFVCVFGGTVYSGISSVPSPDTFYCLQLSTTTWFNLTSLGGPGPRSGSVVRALGKKLYIVGGVNAFLQTLSEIWEFDSCSLSWINMTPTTGPQLSPRHVAVGEFVDVDDDLRLTIYGGETITFVHSFAFGIAKDSFAIFGGDRPGKVGNCTDGQNPTNEVWDFNPNNSKWILRGTSVVQRPSPLKRHTCERLNDHGSKGDMFVFGGFNNLCLTSGGHLFQDFILNVYRIQI